MGKKKKAVGLISGGLDSILSLYLVKQQGFHIIGIYILTPFVSGFGEKTLKNLKKFSDCAGFKLMVIETDDDYLDIVKHPRYGYGRNINPCIDCHIYMLKKAKKVMERESADFVFTGEVLGQRGKSQTKNALGLVEKGALLEGRLLRPLSALLLPPTIAEIEGIVDRNKLLAIEGKTRSVQLSLVEQQKLTYYQTPAGGCLLTEKGFCQRLSDLIDNKPDACKDDYLLLQLGRHFRISSDTKVVVSRDESESIKMAVLAGKDKHLISSPEIAGIMAIVDGKLNNLALEIFASYASKKTIEVCITKGSSYVLTKTVIGKSKFEYHKYLL